MKESVAINAAEHILGKAYDTAGASTENKLQDHLSE